MSIIRDQSRNNVSKDEKKGSTKNPFDDGDDNESISNLSSLDGNKERNSSITRTPLSSQIGLGASTNGWLAGTSSLGNVLNSQPPSRSQWLSSLFCTSIRSIGFGGIGNVDKGNVTESQQSSQEILLSDSGAMNRSSASLVDGIIIDSTTAAVSTDDETGDLDAVSLTYTEMVTRSLRLGLERQAAKFADPNMQFASFM